MVLVCQFGSGPPDQPIAVTHVSSSTGQQSSPAARTRTRSTRTARIIARHLTVSPTYPLPSAGQRKEIDRMSNIVTIKTQIKDPAALTAAGTRLGLPQPTQGKAKLFSGEVSGLVVNLP